MNDDDSANGPADDRNDPEDESVESADESVSPTGDPRGPANGADEEPPESDDGWRFTLEDIEQREAEAAAEAEARSSRSEPVEAGDLSLEGAAFVILGVVFTLFVISRLVV